MTIPGGMNIFDIMKTQLLFSQRDNMIYSAVILLVFEAMTGFMKTVFEWLKIVMTNYWNKRFKEKFNKQLITVEKDSAELYFERDFKKSDNCWDKADAILSKILNIPECNSLLICGVLEIINNEKEFEITNGIYFKLLQLAQDTENQGIKYIKFKVFSHTRNIIYLREFIDNLVTDFLIQKKNNLGNNLYYFDQITSFENDRDRSMGFTETNQKTIFSKYLFETNRTLDNVYHERQEEVKTRVHQFLYNKEWYDKRGIPYTLGFLFHGLPGTGKTSSIKAIAKTTKRHIININFTSRPFDN